MALILGVIAVPLGRDRASASNGGADAVIQRYRERIPELMAEQGVPGLSIALVDGDEVLWTQGFGTVDGDGTAPVTPDTIFSVQSMSKAFTATAVMQAVEAGLIDLDEPITTYLPDFTVHSVFELHPERRITTRMLLSHTAGFTHEAPVGNNFELEPGTFDEHVRSISDTWLRFPVGRGVAYSNLGIDLAGHVLEQVVGTPFAEVMEDSLLAPLGMDHSTFDRDRIRATADRALGHVSPAPEVPVDVPMTAAGGLYASAADLARFLRFELNGGTLDGRRVLAPELMEEMRTVPEPHAGDRFGFGLGVARTGWYAGRNADLFNHGGGGFGFLSDLWWLPQLHVGIAVLTNSSDHQLQGNLALSILNELVHEPGSIYLDRLNALPTLTPVIQRSEPYEMPPQFDALIAAAALPRTAADADRWADYTGEYRAGTWGVIEPMGPVARFGVTSGNAYFEAPDDAGGPAVRHPLAEVRPGIFIAADNGETLDLRGATPTWRSIELTRVSGGPSIAQWILLGGVGVASAAWLLAGAVVAVRRRRSRTEPDESPRSARPAWRRAAAALGAMTALLSIVVVGSIVAVPTLVDSGFIGNLELPVAFRLLAHVPFGFALMSSALGVVVAIGWQRRWWSRVSTAAYGILALGSLALVAQLLAWRLVGLGIG